MVKFGPLVFYLFGPLVINLVLWFSIYSVLRIGSNVPVRFFPNIWGFFSQTFWAWQHCLTCACVLVLADIYYKIFA